MPGFVTENSDSNFFKNINLPIAIDGSPEHPLALYLNPKESSNFV